MSYCVKCGVLLGEKECKCPLCGTAVLNPDSQSLKCANSSDTSYKERATVRYNKNKYTSITGFCLFMIMLIVAVLNLSINGRINWAAIPLASIGFLWFIMVFPVKYSGKLNTIVIIDACIGGATAFLIILDALTSFNGWSLIVLYSSALVCFSITVSIISGLKVKHIISLIALTAAIYILALDMQLGFTGWSLYSAGGLALAWSFFLLPLYINRKYNVIAAIIFNSFLVLAYLFFSLGANGYADKFLTFALPLVVSLALPVAIIRTVWYKTRCSSFGILSMCFFFAALASLAVDRIFNLNVYNDAVFFHEWSIITAICCFAIAVILFIIEKNAKLREFFEKKLNV